MLTIPEYRGKTIDTNKWLYGNFVYTKYECPDKEYYEIQLFDFDERDSLIHNDVDKNTVCEYTQMTDSKGNKIFGKDILKSYYSPVDSVILELYVQVINVSGSWKVFHAKDKWFKDLFEFLLDNADDVEVIGNIFDNPELINK
jgi:uncharacterized phage protein (TIGR01671 family)